MNPILDLLNRLFIASPTLALEEVKHLFEQYMRDISFWKGKACSWQAEAEAHIDQNKELLADVERLTNECADLFENGAEVTRELKHTEAQYANLLDQKHDLEKRLHGYDLDMRGMCSMKDIADARIKKLEAQLKELERYETTDTFEDPEF